MSFKDDPLQNLHFLRIFDWITADVLINKIFFSSILAFMVVLTCIGLYADRTDSDRLFTNLVVVMGLTPCLSVIFGYFSTIATFIGFRSKAVKIFRSVRSEGPKVYDKITRFSRIVTVWLWSYFTISLLIVICIVSDTEVRKELSIYNVTRGHPILEGLSSSCILICWMFIVLGIAQHARWTHYIWIQTVLLESRIMKTLRVMSKKDDKEEQKLCKRRLREVARFHSALKSIAKDYFQVIKVNSVLLFFPAVGTLTMAVLFMFTDKCDGIKFGTVLAGIDTLFALYTSVMSSQLIIDQSEQLRLVLYDCPWYNWDKGNCTSLIIIMSVMKEPLMNTGILGVYEFNYKMFLTALRLTYGLVTAVLNLR